MAGRFSPKKYEIKLRVEQQRDFKVSFTAEVRIHVEADGEVTEFDLKLDESLKVESLYFYQASFISRGHPFFIGHKPEFTVSDNVLHANVRSVTPEAIQEGGYIEIRYTGEVINNGEKKGLYGVIGTSSIAETNLEGDNVTALLPILEDVPVQVDLKIESIFEDLAVEANLNPENNSKTSDDGIVSYNSSSGEEKVKLSELGFQFIIFPVDPLPEN